MTAVAGLANIGAGAIAGRYRCGFQAASQIPDIDAVGTGATLSPGEVEGQAGDISFRPIPYSGDAGWHKDLHTFVFSSLFLGLSLAPVLIFIY